MKLRLFITVVFLSLLVFSSCTNENKRNTSPVIIDRAGILSQVQMDTLSRLDLHGEEIVIYTTDSLSISCLRDSLKTIWDRIYNENGFSEEGTTLILGSKKPNCAYIFYDEVNDNIIPIKNGYASQNYFLTQINDSLSPSDKLLEMVRFAMNSYDRKWNIINLLENEFIGFFYELALPSSSWFYNNITRNCQRLFSFLSKIFGFWISIIFLCVVFNLISNTLRKKVIQYVAMGSENVAMGSENMYCFKIIFGTIVCKLISIIFYIIPIVLCIISVLYVRCICGVEFATDIAEIENTGLSEIYGHYKSNVASTSLTLSLLSVALFSLSIWYDMYFYRENMSLAIFILPFIFFSCVYLPNGANWIIIVMSIINMPSALKKIIEVDGFSYWTYGTNPDLKTRQQINRDHLLFLFYLITLLIIFSIIFLLCEVLSIKIPMVDL